jgi:hypothetical protein
MTFEVVFSGNPRKDDQFRIRADHLTFQEIEKIGAVVGNVWAFVHNMKYEKTHEKQKYDLAQFLGESPIHLLTIKNMI